MPYSPSAEPLTRLADGTVKQISPFTGTEVWTVPGRANRPISHPVAEVRPLEEADRTHSCAFCSARYLETPPEKARVVRGADGGVYFADLGWLLVRLLLEVDGEVKLAVDPDGEMRRRIAREEAIREAGFDVLRLTPEDLRDSRAAVRRIWDALPPSARDASPITALLTTHERDSGGLRPSA